jgi:tetratricopeptide (TPR) repeat protein
MSKIENIYSKADEMFFDADNRIREGKIVEARDILINLINQFPEYGRAYNHLGWIYETKYKDYKKAEEYYKKALELSPDYPAVYLNYAEVLSTLEKFDELEELLNKALNVPGVAKDRIYNEFGIMYELKGDFSKAIDFYKKAIAASLSEEDIGVFSESIERCKTKKDILH